MSQEIQLSLAPQGGNLPQTSSWSGPTTLGPAAPPPPGSPLAVMHQHLRGRYGATLVVAAIFAALFGGAGFLAFHAGYQSVGTIQINPVKGSPDLYDKIIPLWQNYVATVMSNLHSERVIRAAMQSPEWKAVRKGPPEQYLADWNKNLVTKIVPNSYVITITYTDDHKDGERVAPIAVSSLITAYHDIFGDEERKALDEKLSVWKRSKTLFDQRIATESLTINQLLQNFGEEPQKVFELKLRQHILLEQTLREKVAELEMNRAELKKAQEEAGVTPPTIEDFARVDPSMQEMYRVKISEELDYHQMCTQLGSNHRASLIAKQKVDNRIKMMNDYRDRLTTQFFIKPRPDGLGSMLIRRDLSVEEDQVKRLQNVWANEKLYLDDIGHRAHEVSDLRAEKARNVEASIHADKQIDELTHELEMANTFKVIDYNSRATIGTDKRIIFGALGVLGGAGMPIGVMLLLSLMNPRLRFSDEATSETTAGLTLLGILPDLPDRLSDPEQASIAAHCVHQIRTMLQINGGIEDRRVFAITSAAPGDGKTSLTLALGLSYAACGARTLLIDCDLVGSGLTTRMNVATGDGVLEAIAHRSLLEYVRSTDITDVSILPVGSGQNLHASTLSPAALRRLIEEAKKHFDTILIDTGPVLGSIEASLVAAAADAVVLTISRGQQRPLVDKTIQQLKNIKANLAGVVFNRAQTSDFDRSISGLSLRSVSAGQGHNYGTRMGPVARAVQSAFKPAGEE